jgi:hypothetical protein
MSPSCGRVRWGLHEGAIDRPRLERIANEAAGDARIGIGILRNAARKAEDWGRTEITDDVLDEAIPSVRAAVHKSTVEKLPGRSGDQPSFARVQADATRFEDPGEDRRRPLDLCL